MLIGVARTSTIEQVAGLDAQVKQLKEYGCEKIYKEQVSSVGEREQLNVALGSLRSGDKLVVTKLDRLARSVRHLGEIIDTVNEADAALVILDMGGTAIDTSNATGKLILNVMSSVSQFEREMMLERQREGIAKAKADGKYKGRKPTARNKTDTVMVALKQGIGPAQIMRDVGISKTSFYRIVKEYANTRMELGHFNKIKEKYQYYASWAVWAEGKLPKENVGDLSILDPTLNTQLLGQLNPNIVLVALNIAAVNIEDPWGNFHSGRGHAQDYKIRHVMRDTPLWGAYMTDIIKDHPELVASNVEKFLGRNPDVEREHVESFKQELTDIGAEKPKLIAFGNVVYNILTRNLGNEFEIFRIRHYSHFMNRETYRNEVLELCEQL